MMEFVNLNVMYLVVRMIKETALYAHAIPLKLEIINAILSVTTNSASLMEEIVKLALKAVIYT